MSDFVYVANEEEINSADAETGDTSQLLDAYVEGGNTIIASESAALHGSYGYDITFAGTDAIAYLSRSLAGDSEYFHARFYVKFLGDTYPYRDARAGFEIPFFGTWDVAGNRYGLYYTLGIGHYSDEDPYVLVFKQYYWTGSEYYSSQLSLDYFENKLDQNICIELFEDRVEHDITVWIDGDTRGIATGAATTNWINDEFRVGILGGDTYPSAGQKLYIDDILIKDSYIGFYKELPVIISGIAATEFEQASIHSYNGKGSITFSGITAYHYEPIYSHSAYGEIILSGIPFTTRIAYGVSPSIRKVEEELIPTNYIEMFKKSSPVGGKAIHLEYLESDISKRLASAKTTHVEATEDFVESYIRRSKKIKGKTTHISRVKNS